MTRLFCSDRMVLPLEKGFLMGFPWYLKPDWLLHAEMLDAQEALAQSADSSRAADQKQDQQIEALNRRVAELEAQLLALETLLSEKGILPPPPQEEAAPGQPPAGSPAVFPARTDAAITCPRCGRRQKGNRDSCYACETPFRYEDE